MTFGHYNYCKISFIFVDKGPLDSYRSLRVSCMSPAQYNCALGNEKTSMLEEIWCHFNCCFIVAGQLIWRIGSHWLLLDNLLLDLSSLLCDHKRLSVVCLMWKLACLRCEVILNLTISGRMCRGVKLILNCLETIPSAQIWDQLLKETCLRAEFDFWIFLIVSRNLTLSYVAWVC
jgi:hypothetical protein